MRQSPLNYPWRWALWLGFRLARCWWCLRRPMHTGALVILRLDNQVLLLRSAYRSTLNLPGGGVRRHEHPAIAAAREMQEEIGFTVLPEQLRPIATLRAKWDFRRDHIHLFEIRLTSEPYLRLDGREITAAFWGGPDACRALPPFLHPFVIVF